MKYRSIFFILFPVLAAASHGYGQCPSNNISLRTQAQVNAFPSTCTSPVNLTIDGSGITDLTPLKNVVSVSIDLRIENTSIISLEGLEKLESVGKGFRIERNNSLTDLTGLEKLENVGASTGTGLSQFTIGYNENLVSLQGLEKLKVVKGYFSINTNKSLANLAGIYSQLETADAFSLLNNESLTSLTTLGVLPEIITGSIGFSYNQNLTDINAFSNVKRVNGDFSIERSPITSLAPLSNLEIVTGDLRFRELNIASLNGLGKLQTVEGLFELYSLPLLTSLNGVNSLEYYKDLHFTILNALSTLEHFPSPEIIEGNLHITGNRNLSNLTGLSNLREVRGNVNISGPGNAIISSLNGLNNLETIGGNLLLSSSVPLDLSPLSQLETVGGELTLGGNGISTLNGLENLKTVGSIKLNFVDYFSGLNNIDALAGITSVSGSISIEARMLTNLNGLRNITHIGGSLSVTNSPALEDISGLSNMESIGGTLSLLPTGKIANLNALSKLRTLGGLSLSFSSTSALSDLSGLSGVTSIENSVFGNIQITGSSNNLTSLHGLHNIESISGALVISSTLLQNFNGLEKLKTVGRLEIINNSNLENFSGLGALETLGIVNVNGGIQRISNNNKIKNLVGLSNLKNVNGNLEISNNNSLVNFQGLANLKNINNTLELSNNNSLVNLQGLEKLESAGWVRILLNPKLETLIGLGPARPQGNSQDRVSNTPAIFGALQITNNAILSECEAWSVCNYLDTKNATVSGNAAGCNTQNQIKEACETALPVTLASFKASPAEANSVRLDWTTTEEAGASHFEAEHSLTGRNWSKIGEMKAAGNNSSLKSYTYIHTNPSLSVNYYRLKSVDQDGSFAYSAIESIRLGGIARSGVEALVPYPNPVSDRLYLKLANLNDISGLKLYSAAGNEVNVRLDTASQSLDVRHLPVGIYLLRINRQDGATETLRVLIGR